MREKIREFLSSNKDISNLEDDDNLFEKGFVNSLFALQLIMFLEKEYKIKIPNEYIKEENFNSVTNIENTLKQLIG